MKNQSRFLMFLIVTYTWSFLGCQSDTQNVEQVKTPKMERQIKDVEIKSQPAESKPLETTHDIRIPKLPEVNKEKLNAPPEVKSASEVKLIDVVQVISIKRNEDKPMLDLLFVMDDSASMEPHQANLAAAMKSFTRELSKLDLLDSRIGVTSIYDSSRYFKKGEPGEDRFEQGITEWSRTEFLDSEKTQPKRNFYRLGRLLPIKDVETGTLLSDSRFATAKTNIKNLEETLKIGAQPFEKYDLYNYTLDNSKFVFRNQNRITGAFSNKELGAHKEILTKEARGPRFEEVLAPMLAALTPQSLLFGDSASHYRDHFPSTESFDNDSFIPPLKSDKDAEEKWQEFAAQYNSNFVREKAHLGVIFVTDTIDQSFGLNAKMAAEALRKLKNDDGSFSKISTFGVLHKNTISYDLQKKFSGEWSRRHCTVNNRVDDDVLNMNGQSKPQMLEEFLILTAGNKTPGSNILNICSPRYGENLIQIAKNLFKDSLQRGEYDLERVPARGIKVTYKDQPNKEVPTCSSGKNTGLCWQILIKPGLRKLVLFSQHDLGLNELEVKYQAVDPRTANSLNSSKIGN